MHKMYELKDKLIDELESYADNGKITPTDAEAIKYLASSVDHICNICKEAEDDDFSGRSYPDMGGNPRRYSRNDGYSMARRRRDSMGRYSGADGDIESVKRDVMELAEKVKAM